MSLVDLYPVVRIPAVFIFDALLGDPKWVPHPVALTQKLVTFFEKVFRRIYSDNPAGERSAGISTVVVLTIVCCVLPAGILYAMFRAARHFYLPPLTYAAFLLDIFWGYQTITARSLSRKARDVFRSLDISLEQARRAVRRITNRDTEYLDGAGVIRTTVETVAEKTTDSASAPLIMFAIGGAPLALFYKAITTMREMTDCKKEGYRYFGKCAAVIDDVLGFIPARLSAVFMLLGTLFCLPVSAYPVRFRPVNAFRIYFRDRSKKTSLNAAQNASVCAGALGIRLGSSLSYENNDGNHPEIGDPLKRPDTFDIQRAVLLMYMAASLSAVFCTGIRFVAAVLF